MDNVIVTTSWDDGHPADPRLAELLDKYDVPATFYVPIHNSERALMSHQQINEIAQVFDIGGHSYNHVNLTKLPSTQISMEITECKKTLENVAGKEISSFSYPWGAFNNRVINYVRQAGFACGRTTRSLTRIIDEPFAMNATVNATNWWFVPYIKHSLASKDPLLFFFMLRNNLFFKNWHTLAIETLHFIIKNGGVWHLWGHSWEIDQNSDWRRLEEVFQEISNLSKEAKLVNNSELIRIFNSSPQELNAV